MAPRRGLLLLLVALLAALLLAAPATAAGAGGAETSKKSGNSSQSLAREWIHLVHMRVWSNDDVARRLICSRQNNTLPSLLGLSSTLHPAQVRNAGSAAKACARSPVGRATDASAAVTLTPTATRAGDTPPLACSPLLKLTTA